MKLTPRRSSPPLRSPEQRRGDPETSEELTVSSRDLYDVIARRRDVRAEFSGEAVDCDVLRRVLQAAHEAPSVGHSQPWDFVLVADKATRDTFVEHVETERRVFAEQLPAERRETFDRIKVEGIRESGLGVVVTYDQARGGQHVLGRHAIADTGVYSTCLAIQNLWLAATAEGLGVGWVSFYREEFLADLVGLPDGVRPVAWLCLGPVSKLQEVPDLVRHGWRKGRSLYDAVHLESWRG
ncbi:5,6-dimethylbenzimidazole synthase [Nocardioides sp. S-58]|uniref:5,6-dimethylbenzimidazole synthase n=1 Tax=Nocardioides renjunii TaxID=3095075 RepID=A0ABU5K7P4_9ACTN|nr:5,6-dimethylbenzimidazole synthase [Nocardioides sp. S-58]MDZ5660988.1 5,6-dimethylbenzimidazole synthase [Nocardioides sp. S-58]